MNWYRRNAAVAVAAVLATAAAGAVAALGGAGGRSVTGPESRAALPEVAPASQAPTTEVVPDTVDARPVDARLARRAERTARTFTAAFLRYEVGSATNTDRQVLRALATPDLAAALLDTPPRLPRDRPRPARIVSVELVGADDTTAEVAIRAARPRAGTSTIVVVLAVAGRRVMVTGLR